MILVLVLFRFPFLFSFWFCFLSLVLVPILFWCRLKIWVRSKFGSSAHLDGVLALLLL